MKKRCPLGITKPSHFREDGTCLCYEAEEPDQKKLDRWKKEAVDSTRKLERKGKEVPP